PYYLIKNFKFQIADFRDKYLQYQAVIHRVHKILVQVLKERNHSIKILLFLLGVVSSVEVICFAIGRENCPSSLSGTVVAVTNFLVVSFAIFQVIVAKILDWTWDSTIIDEARVYGVESYQTAMLVLPISTFLAFALAFFLKETYCRSFEDRRITSVAS
ncbi:MAG: hypothetical protein ACHQJ6_08385, partial [Candidatus Berkiellales bacterium]